jgi:RNA recognition motif-containing protein
LELERERTIKTFHSETILSKNAVYIRNLPKKFTETDLKDNFGRFGEI